MPEKYYNDNQEVALIISESTGSGWSTWAADDESSEILLYHPDIVRKIINNEMITREWILEKFPNIKAFFNQQKLTLKWVKSGEKFYLYYYDGAEILITENMMRSA